MSPLLDLLSAQLNTEQFEAAIHTSSSSLILAGAGSGKTRTLTYKIAYMIYGLGIRPSRIMAVTFTNKAANEMKHRLVDLSQQFQAYLAEHEGGQSSRLPSIDLNGWGSTKWIGTFHGIFLKMLKEELWSADLGYTTNFWVYDDAETTSVMKDILKKLKLEEIELREAKGFISKLKNQGITAGKYKYQAATQYEQTMFQIYESYEKSLKEANSLDFDDLLLLPYLIWTKFPELLSKRQKMFDYVLVDEAQDTNWIQFELMKQLTRPDGNVTFIGDDFQSIYRRRGAMMENFLNVKAIRPDMVMYKLETNYRSRPHIVHAGSHIIKNNSKQYEKTIKAHRGGDDKIVVFTHRDDTDEAHNIIDLMTKLNADKGKKRWDMAVLYRTNAQSGPFEQVLIQEGIPYKIFGGFKFFERKEIKDVLAYLKLILNPRDNVSLKRIINTPKRKIWPDSVSKLEEYAIVNGMTLREACERIETLPVGLWSMASNAIRQFVAMMRFLREGADMTPPVKLIQQIVDTIRYKDYLIATEGKDPGSEKYENIWQLINMASKYGV